MPPTPRCLVQPDLTDPLTEMVLRACTARARTPRYLSITLGVALTAVHQQLDHLVAAGLLAAEAPSRVNGRLVTPFRTMPGAATRAHDRQETRR